MQTATGVLGLARSIIQKEFKTAPSSDIDADTLKCYQSIMKAQAQEVLWHKAVLGSSVT
jgi:hypothetical protein